MSDTKLTLLFFVVGMLLALASMVLGPFGITNWSIACAIFASFLAVFGMIFGFSSWNDPVVPKTGGQKEENQELDHEI